MATTFSSPHWLGDEEILELGISVNEVESYRRYHYMQSFGVQKWYHLLEEHTFRSHFLPLKPKEVSAILRIHFALSRRAGTLYHGGSSTKMEEIQVLPEDMKIVSMVEKRLEEAISAFPGGVFIKLNTRSPKDVCINCTWDHQRVKNLMESFEYFLMQQSKAKVMEKGTFAEKDVMAAFVQSCTLSMKISNANDAIDLLLESSRVQQDLSRVESYGSKNVRASIVVRKWNENIVTRNHMEFRGFVYKNQLNAVTQYDELTYYKDIHEQKEEIEERILSFFNANVQKKLEGIESYVIDFFVDVDKVYVIELNPFHNGAGAALFSWREDRELFMNGPFELRIIEEPKEKPLAHLSLFWERKLGEYIKRDDEEGYSTGEYTKAVICAAIAVVIAGWLQYAFLKN